VRPGDARAQQNGHAIDQLQMIEARAELAPRIVRSHGIVSEAKAAASQVCLAVIRRVEPLRLQCCIRRDAERSHAIAIAAFEPPAIALRAEFRGELVANRNARLVVIA